MSRTLLAISALSLVLSAAACERSSRRDEGKTTTPPPSAVGGGPASSIERELPKEPSPANPNPDKKDLVHSTASDPDGLGTPPSPTAVESLPSAGSAAPKDAGATE
jgi:hypothetical protein